MGAHRVFLVPGFFGFTNLGDFLYFQHAKEILEERLSVCGVDATVRPLDTLPTASIADRARHLAMRLVEHADGDGPIHLVGHSTGGLDARLLVSASAQLWLDEDARAVVRRVSSVITLATPHRGAPLASFFTSMAGQRLLRLLSLATVHLIRLGSIPLPVLLFLGGAIANTGALSWLSGGVLDITYDRAVSEIDCGEDDDDAGDPGPGGDMGQCNRCSDCTDGLACVAGSCGACRQDSDCCKLDICDAGRCRPF